MKQTLQPDQLEFEFDFACPFIEAEYYREGAEDLIRKLIPEDFLNLDSSRPALQRARFADMLPFIQWSSLEKAPCSLSVLLLCKYRLNASNFFCDMVTRWLLPGRQINAELFFTSDVRLPHLSEDLFTVAEVVVYLKSASEMEAVRKNLRSIETEIRLGIVSNYHARRILEFKGLSTDGKTAMIQEKISSLIQSHSKDFEQGIFSQMQQFLVNCPEDFKKIRDYHHISRMISNLYSARKMLKQNREVFPEKRHVILKFFKTNLSTPKPKTVLGILAGLNFLREHEVFEEEHLITAIQQILPHAHLVSDSAVDDSVRETALKTVYLEIEKKDGSEFSLEEIQSLKNQLPEALKGNIEQLTNPIFMPRNEEEVLRNIVSLSRQIRSTRDLPQVIISFDETRSTELQFTVILVRVCSEGDPSVGELVLRRNLQYIPEKVRIVGTLRGKYVKEATVFRTTVVSDSFRNSDRSVDVSCARKFVYEELCRALGELRDYNGGMILKQQQQLDALKLALPRSALARPMFVEKLFYAIQPVEMRTSVGVEPLKQMILLFLAAAKSEARLPIAGPDFLFKQEENRVLAVLPSIDVEKKKVIMKKIEALNIPRHQFATVSLEINDASYLGLMLLSEDVLLQEKILSSLA